MNRVLVTGGSGFIGTNLMSSLTGDGIDALSFDWKAPREAGLSPHHREGNILDLDRLTEVMMNFRPNAVIHLAARCDLAGQSLADYSANIGGVTNVISAIRKTSSVKRVLFASSRYVHKNEEKPLRDDEYSPFTMYGRSKVETEKLVRSSNLEVPWTLIRPTSIWGPWFDIPYKGFFQAVRRGLYVHPRGEKIYKTYGYVGNVVHQIRSLVSAPLDIVAGRMFYVADYKPIEVRSMAEKIRVSFGAPPVREAQLTLMKSVARVGDVFRKCGMYNPPLTSFRLSNLRVQMVYDITDTEQVVGKLPFSEEEGIERTVAWMRAHA